MCAIDLYCLLVMINSPMLDISFAKMNNRLNWDDLRLVLAISSAGTLSGAGRALGVSHATVFRRLGEIEDRMGVKLFERSRRGYAATLAGEEMAAAARRVESEVLDVERRVAGRDLRPAGTVRVTTTDTLLLGLLSPIFAEFREAYNEIDLEVAVSNDLFSLSRREADVAIRPSSVLPEPLVGHKIGVISQAIYGNRKQVAGMADIADLRSAAWVGPDETMAYRPLERWMRERGLADAIRYRVNTVLGLFAAVRDGAGLAALPCYLADDDEELVRLGEPVPDLSTDIWLLTHPDLRKAVRIREFMTFVSDAVGRQSVRLG